MEKSEITKKYQRNYWICFAVSTLLFFGTCAFLVIYGFSTAWATDTGAEANAVVDAVRATYSVLLITLFAGIIIFIIIKEKIRNTVWMANLVMSVCLFGATGMWIVLGLWAADEFIVIPFKKYFREKTSINKEIDKRL